MFNEDKTAAYVPWTIKVKLPAGVTLQNAKIIDTLPANNHTFIGTSTYPVQIKHPGGTATVVEPGSDKGNYSISGQTLTYNFLTGHPTAGASAATYELTYWTTISNWDITLDTNGAVTVKNGAMLEWDNGSGSGVGGGSTGTAEFTKEVVAGGGLISKSAESGTSFAFDPDGNFIKWTVEVNRNKIPMNGVTLKDTVTTNDGHVLVISGDKPFKVFKNNESTAKELTGPGTIAGYGTLDISVLAGGQASGFEFALPESTSDTFVFEFYTKITQDGYDEMYINGEKTFKNEATLKDHRDFKAIVTATKKFDLQMLKKEAGTYNHATRTVTWTATINRNKLPMTDAFFTDLLPAGMVLLDSSDDLGEFRVKVNGGAEQPLTAAGIDFTQTTDGFKLDLPTPSFDSFVITYKTYLTDDALQESFTKSFTNDATLKLAENEGGITAEATSTITNTVIKKDTDYKTTSKDDVMHWSIAINPGQAALNNAVVEDVLNAYLTLSSGSVKLYEGVVASNGTVTKGTEVTLTESSFEHGTNSEGKEFFKVHLPAEAKAYILEFATIIMAENVSVNNKITLTGSDESPTGDSTKTGVNVSDIYSSGGSGAYALRVQKLDQDGNPLQDAKLVLLKPNGQVHKKGGSDYGVVTNENGYATFTELPRWFFAAREVVIPDGYLLADDSGRVFPTRADELDDAFVHITMRDELGLGDVSIYKIDAAGNPVPGGEFGLYTIESHIDEDGTPYHVYNPIAGPVAADASGIVKFENIPAGEYLIREDVAPDGYLKTHEMVEVTVAIAEDGKSVEVSYESRHKHTVGENKYPALVNIPLAKIVIAKIDSVTGLPIKNSTGSEFELYYGDWDPEEDVYVERIYLASAGLNADGFIVFEDLTIDYTYTLVEVSPPDGYAIENTGEYYVSFNISDDGLQVGMDIVGLEDNETTVYTDENGITYPAIANEPLMEVIVVKVDDNGEPIIKDQEEERGLFGLYTKEDVLVAGPVAADENGFIRFTGIQVGEYVIKEITAPEGYIQTEKVIEVYVGLSDDGKSVVVTYESDNYYTDGEDIYFALRNIPYTSVKIAKIDGDGELITESTDGLFALYMLNPETDLYDIFIGDVELGADGFVVFEGLEPAQYKVIEKTAPAGYHNFGFEGNFEVREDWNSGQIVVVYEDGFAEYVTDDEVVYKAIVNLPLSELVLVKIDGEGNAVSGGKFGLYRVEEQEDESEEFVLIAGPVAADENGFIRFENVHFGYYVIREDEAPEGYLATDQMVLVSLIPATEGLSVDINYDSDFYHEIDEFTYAALMNIPLAKIEIAKVDAKTNELLTDSAGGKFGLYLKEGSPYPLIQEVDLDQYGFIVFEGLEPGIYLVMEESAPEGYNHYMYSITVEITINEEGTMYEIEYIDAAEYEIDEVTVPAIYNVPWTDVVVSKLNQFGNPVRGGEFGLYRIDQDNEGWSEVLVGTTEADGNGLVKFADVPVGLYVVKEHEAPNKHIATEKTVTINVFISENGRDLIVEYFSEDVDEARGNELVYQIGEEEPIEGYAALVNEYVPSLAKITILKTDTEGKPLAGAEFALYDANGNVVAVKLTGDDGLAEFNNLVPFTKYSIRETAAPVKHTGSNEVIVVTTGDGTHHEFIVENEYVPDNAKVIVKKVDTDGNALEGAEFTLYDDEGEVVEVIATGQDGLAVFEDLAPYEDYVIKETAAPWGYLASDEELEVKTGDGSLHEFTVVNEENPVVGSITIAKIDKDDERLEGAKLGLFDQNGNKIAEAVSGEDGVVVFDKLPGGKYTVKELEAPEGFKPIEAELEVELTEEKADRIYTLTNYTEDEEDPDDPDDWTEIDELPPYDPGDLPDAGGISPSMKLLAAGTLLIAAGVVLGLFRRKRQARI